MMPLGLAFLWLELKLLSHLLIERDRPAEPGTKPARPMPAPAR